MLLHDWGIGLLRRWYFVVLGVLLTAGGALFLTTVVPPTYQATARVMLMPPASIVTPTGNPYLFMGQLDQALSVLNVRLSSGAQGERMLQNKTDSAFSVVKDPMSPAPIILITAEGQSAQDAVQILDNVLEAVPDNLGAMQDELNIPASSRISAMTLVREPEPERIARAQLRTVLAAVAAGLSLTVLLTAILDRFLSKRTEASHRRRRRDEEAILADAVEARTLVRASKDLPGTSRDVPSPPPQATDAELQGAEMEKEPQSSSLASKD